MFTHILFFDKQYLTYQLVVVDRFDVLFRIIYGVDTDAVDYNDYLYNNNDTQGFISGVGNDCSSTLQYGNNNINFIDANGVFVMHLTYNSVDLVMALDTISSSR